MELTIGEVAARTGVTERTLRHDEDLGLLASAHGACVSLHLTVADVDAMAARVEASGSTP